MHILNQKYLQGLNHRQAIRKPEPPFGIKKQAGQLTGLFAERIAI
jgi:hypothetical protein